MSNLAPLLDVLFLLLIFLLVAANFDERRVIPVDLPSASTAQRPREADPDSRIVITLFRDGSLWLDGVAVTRDDLGSFLESRPVEARLLPVRIEGDERAALGTGLELLDLLRRLGYFNCAFEVRRGSPDE